MSISQAFIGGYKSSQSAGTNDPYFSSVVLLMHLNNSLVDSSSKTTNGTSSGTTPTYTTSASGVPAKIGSGSLVLVSGTRVLVSTANLTFAADFTIEFWVYPDQVTNPVFLDTGSSSSGYQFYINKGTLQFQYKGSSFVSGGTVTVNTWSHIAVSRIGNTLRIFVNGTLTNTATISGTLPTAQATMALNYQQNNGPVYFGTGYMDEVRITNGVGRYTSNFTPSLAEFPNQ